MTVSIIVAAADNGVIGREGDLPWRLPDDLKFFKETTLGHPIIMGRKTYASIGRALPGRTNIVVSRQPDFVADGCVVAQSLSEAIERARASEGGESVFIIGGATLYTAALNLADRVYLTHVRATVDGDTRMPPLGERFVEVSRTAHAADERHAHPFDFVVLNRR